MGVLRPFPGGAAPKLCAPRPIRATDDRDHFDCGHDALNDWLRSKSVFSEGRSARTFVVCNNEQVVAYYCIASGSVQKLEAPRKMRFDMPDPIPIAVLGRLAVDNRYKGMKLAPAC